jgi:nicotinamidase-related amidase
VPELKNCVDLVVCKVAYSAFFNTQLDWVLRKAAIETVVVCGIVTNGGVASTARDAHLRDYKVVVLSDGSAAFSDALHQASLADLASIGQVMTCEAFVSSLA